MTTPRTLSEKIWDAHVIESPLADAARREALGAEADAGAPADLLYIDLHLVHEVTSPQAFEGAAAQRTPGAPSGSHARHRRPQRADDRAGSAEPGPALRDADPGDVR